MRSRSPGGEHRAPARGAFVRALATPPNVVTLSRLAFLFAALGMFHAHVTRAALVLGTLAGLTDYLDGWLARRLGQVTRLGEILDQFCDIALELSMLLVATSLPDGLPRAILAPYVLREIWVAGIRRFTAEHGVNIASRKSGKLKSALLGWSSLPLFAGALGLAGAASPVLLRVGQLGIGLGLACGLVSGAQYTLDFISVYNRRVIDERTA